MAPRQSVPSKNNGGAVAADIALCMELITFGGFGTPSALLLLQGAGFFGGRGRTANDIGPARLEPGRHAGVHTFDDVAINPAFILALIPRSVPTRDDFQASGQPDARRLASHFLCTADLGGLTAPHG